jgi:hypothetical protein
MVPNPSVAFPSRQESRAGAPRHLQQSWIRADSTTPREYDAREVESMRRVKAIARSPAAGYAAALAVPVAITYGVTWLNMPPFVFEHLVVLLVLGVAIPWGLGPAVLTAIVPSSLTTCC